MPFLKAVIASSLLLLPAPLLADERPALNRNDPDAIRCRKIEVIGSLVRKTRVCKTNAQWKTIVDHQSREAQDLVDRNRSGTVMSN
ncbi:hypothetical protein [Sphingobium sp. Ant17]|uniref:hypothetical protein n=1 Tax=Sphingobium sp. Ant17 TaxID=1461752 RepID=UPI0004475A93|nr:hypothetical protein [Sphingobium sp. Ant17]EXS68801.1 hypothetical protein BF95_12465 [Sphingobium sp. Ant17]|tara:strand:- start:7663 stop:7920 length:258 start_codon:yes stop_codon:yes gene_type:complete